MYRNPLHNQTNSPEVGSQKLAFSHKKHAFTNPSRHLLQLPDHAPSPQIRATGSPSLGGAYPSLYFDLAGFTKQGMSMKVIVQKGVDGTGKLMSDAHERVAQRLLMSKIHLHILWPQVREKGGKVIEVGHMTKAELAFTVASAYSRFMELNRAEISTSPLNYKFDKLVLVGIYHLADDSWQADVAIDL